MVCGHVPDVISALGICKHVGGLVGNAVVVCGGDKRLTLLTL